MCVVCLTKKDLGMAHMIDHFKPIDVQFIHDDYIIVDTRMDTDTEDEEYRKLLSWLCYYVCIIVLCLILFEHREFK